MLLNIPFFLFLATCFDKKQGVTRIVGVYFKKKEKNTFDILKLLQL